MLFKQTFSDYSNLDDRHFTTLHRIILGLDDRDLYNYLQVCPRKEINRCDAQGNMALHWAAQSRRTDMVRLLLEHGSDPNYHDNLGYSALHDAVKTGDPAGVSYLLKYGANVNARTQYGITPLMLTTSNLVLGWRNRDLACAQCLIDAGADVNAQDITGGTPLLYASQHGLESAVEHLLKNGAEVNRPALNGETPLIVAIQTDQRNIPQILLAHGADLAYYTPTGRSILHEAAEYGDEQTLRLLISLRIQGIQIEHRSSDGKTARDLAGKRDDVTGAWRLAFAELLASVNESRPESPHEKHHRFLFGPLGLAQQRLSDLARIVEDRWRAEVLHLHERMSGLIQLQILVMSALFVLAVAIIWHALGATYLGKETGSVEEPV